MHKKTGIPRKQPSAQRNAGLAMRWALVIVLWLYSHHAIPDSNMGLDILRRTRLFFQFLTQRSHKYAQGCNIVFPASSPNLLGDERMGQHLAHIFTKQGVK